MGPTWAAHRRNARVARQLLQRSEAPEVNAAERLGESASGRLVVDLGSAQGGSGVGLGADVGPTWSRVGAVSWSALGVGLGLFWHRHEHSTIHRPRTNPNMGAGLGLALGRSLDPRSLWGGSGAVVGGPYGFHMGSICGPLAVHMGSTWGRLEFDLAAMMGWCSVSIWVDWCRCGVVLGADRGRFWLKRESELPRATTNRARP